MKWKVIIRIAIRIALLVFISGCSEEKNQPETNLAESQQTAEPVPAEQVVPEASTPQAATAEATTEKESAAEPTAKPDDAKYFVYYMTSSARCASCYAIENHTKEAVSTHFADEVKSGKVSFLMINVDEKGNQHYIEDYNLYTKSVILSKQMDGKEVNWKNLDKIWQLWNNKAGFIAYIRNELTSFIGSEAN